MTDQTEPRKGGSIQSVIFALNTLEHLAHSRSAIGVSDLARAFDTTKSRMHRHLQTLVKAGYIVREEDTERYRISTRMMSLGQAISANFDLSAAAGAAMRRLRESLGSSVVVSQPEVDGVRVLGLVQGKSQLEIGVRPGAVLAFHNSAQGKIALAFGDAGLLGDVLLHELPMSTPYTIVDPGKLATEIELVRKRGWADAPNESMIGLNALAAPVFDSLGKLAGAIAIVDSIQFVAENPTPEQVQGVIQAANETSANLGYRK
jgi:DNA-binding IclR family transcriptional regulator